MPSAGSRAKKATGTTIQSASTRAERVVLVRGRRCPRDRGGRTRPGRAGRRKNRLRRKVDHRIAALGLQAIAQGMDVVPRLEGRERRQKKRKADHDDRDREGPGRPEHLPDAAPTVDERRDEGNADVQRRDRVDVDEDRGQPRRRPREPAGPDPRLSTRGAWPRASWRGEPVHATERCEVDGQGGDRECGNEHESRGAVDEPFGHEPGGG